MFEPLEIIEKLHRQGAVEAEPMTDFLDCLRGCRWSRKIDRWVARQRPGQQKRDYNHPGDDR